MTGEGWMPIPSCPGYEASDQGRIRSFKRGAPHVLALRLEKSGYLSFTSAQSGSRLPKHVHAAVIEAHQGPRPEGNWVRHLNGDRLDNRAENLAYGTPAENSQDTLLHGRHNNAAKTHCAQGHAYDDANTYRNARGRVCRTCTLDRVRRYRVQKNAQVQS